MAPNTPESVKVLHECAELQLKKSRDYQNPNSTVLQADYYNNGVTTIFDTMHGKMLRMKSVMEAMQGEDYAPNFESLEDSAKDLINYASFFVSYCRGTIPGQNAGRDIFNRPSKSNAPEPAPEPDQSIVDMLNDMGDDE